MGQHTRHSPSTSDRKVCGAVKVENWSNVGYSTTAAVAKMSSSSWVGSGGSIFNVHHQEARLKYQIARIPASRAVFDYANYDVLPPRLPRLQPGYPFGSSK